jgi:hypothetical protein
VDASKAFGEGAVVNDTEEVDEVIEASSDVVELVS